MPDFIPIDEFVSDEWYPGFPQTNAHAPWVAEGLSTFQPGDEQRFWLLDFHYPRGMVPLGYIFPEDGICWGTQLAAELLPLPPSRGLVARMAGPHIYSGQVDVGSSWQLQSRAERIARNLPGFLANFPTIWADRVVELEGGLAHFETDDHALDSLAEIGTYFADAQAFFKRAWEIHFEMMYPLLAAYVGFYGLCQQLGLDPGEISKFLQGHDTKIMEVDRQLWELTSAARRAGLTELFASTPAEQLLAAITASPHEEGKGWLHSFDDFLAIHGNRTEGIADVVLPSWREDTTSPLGTIKTFLQQPGDHDFGAAHDLAVAERHEAIENARSKLSAAQRAQFDEGLAGCEAANFAWWNEEHNYYIDLRAHLPLRRAALALATVSGASEVTDGLFLFRPEFAAVTSGERSWHSFEGVVSERRDFYDAWVARRPELPKVLGTIPDDIDDPVLRGIFGMGHDFFETIRSGSTGTVLSGVAASRGVARGRARVLHGADELHRIEPGEILVCEATSPNWTPAFAKIAGCVCDSGGTLTHAAIVAREYRVPAVVGTAMATNVIATGDLVEVDGTSGVVRVVERAAG
jgi:phosphohistidine swiveling domain-containing protein